MSIDLTELLKEADDHVREELAAKPDVIEVSDLDLDDDPAPITARRWYKVVDVVAVVADLKSSTQLGVRNARGVDRKHLRRGARAAVAHCSQPRSWLRTVAGRLRGRSLLG